MSLFDAVSFGPAEVRQVMSGAPVPRCTLRAVLTSQTCGEPCWHAREEVCRCSCGGRNHGCLLIPGAERPERAAKIDGERYTLLAVGMMRDLYDQAKEINGRQWRSLEKPQLVIGSTGHSKWTQADIDAAKAAGEKVWFTQGYYTWRETDAGAPARIKFASKDQMAKWAELKGWQDRAREGVCLLWQRVTMPEAPTELRVNRDGVPLANQKPNGEQV